MLTTRPPPRAFIEGTTARVQRNMPRRLVAITSSPSATVSDSSGARWIGMGARAVPVPPERVAAVRGFNRFSTNAIGALREGLLDSPYSLTEARLIFELAQVERKDVVDLRRSLDIDAGYLSRILARFERA